MKDTDKIQLRSYQLNYQPRPQGFSLKNGWGGKSRLSRSRFTLSRAYESCLACQRLFLTKISKESRKRTFPVQTLSMYDSLFVIYIAL